MGQCHNLWKGKGPCELITRDWDFEISKNEEVKAAGLTRIVLEMFMADKDCSVEWLTAWCNLIVAQGRIPDDWNE